MPIRLTFWVCTVQIPQDHFCMQSDRKLALCASCFLAILWFQTVPQAADEGVRLFHERIQPVLEQNCFECHAADAKKVRGGLLLDTPSGIRKGGDSGPIVVAGDAGHSLLIQAIQHEGELHMPPNKPKLSGAILADFVKWVELG